MDFLVLSDLHLEHHADGGAEFIRSLRSDVDGIILAGDICGAAMLDKVASQFCAKYNEVIYVLGNHEFHELFPSQVEIYAQRVADKYKNFHWLNGSSVRINGTDFLGGTLWYQDDPLNAMYEKDFYDFMVIKGIKPWVYDKHYETVGFLKRNITEGCVVITHHAPSERSIQEQYERSLLNRFFYNRLDDLIYYGKPKIWIHGHTHCSLDYAINETRIICNSFGYPWQLVPTFKELVITV